VLIVLCFLVGKDAFVLCRIFQKSGTGPKNGEQYGAPFIEEEWDDDEVPLLPSEEMVLTEEAPVGDDAYLEMNELGQVCTCIVTCGKLF
jgi:hypothetical protein